MLNTKAAIENAPNTNSIMFSPLSASSVAAVDIHDGAIAAGLGFAQFEVSLTIVLLKQALARAYHRWKGPQPVLADKIFRHKYLDQYTSSVSAGNNAHG